MYTNLMLFAMVLIGILVHSLIEINKINHDPSKGHFNLRSYLAMEWAAILLNLFIGLACIIAKEEIKELNIAGKYLILGFGAIGFMGQSILASFVGKAQKVIDK